MFMFRKKGHRNRRAVAGIQALVFMPVLLGFTAMVVDVGVMYNARADMQNATDAAAMAAIWSVAYGDPEMDEWGLAFNAAQDYTQRNRVLHQSLELDSESDMILGHAYYDEFANAYNFVPWDVPTNAVRVTLRYSSESPNGPLPLFFASIFGKMATDLSSTAVAIVVQTAFDKADCDEEVPEGSVALCHYKDSDDSDDSVDGSSDDSGSGDSDDSEADDSDESDDSSASIDSDSEYTIFVKSGAVPYWVGKGDTIGECPCDPGDSDSGDSDSGDSDSDSGDSDSGDSDSDSGDSDSGDSDSGDSDSGDSDSGDSDNPKVTICHVPPGNPDNPQTLSIGEPALTAHLNHGDTNGACIEDLKLRIFLIE